MGFYLNWIQLPKEGHLFPKERLGYFFSENISDHFYSGNFYFILYGQTSIIQPHWKDSEDTEDWIALLVEEYEYKGTTAQDGKQVKIKV